MDSIFNKTIDSLLPYLQDNTTDFNDKTIGRVVSSCPLTSFELFLGRNANYLAAVCFTVTDLILTVSISGVCSKSKQRTYKFLLFQCFDESFFMAFTYLPCRNHGEFTLLN